MSGLLESLGGFPPRPGRSCEVVGGIEHLLRFSHSSNLKVVVDGAKPIIGFQWMGSLGVGGWVGLLEVSQSGPRTTFAMSIAMAIAIPIAVAVVVVVVLVVMSGSYLLQSSEMSLTLLPGSLALFHDKS
jgi:hypothetical protein